MPIYPPQLRRPLIDSLKEASEHPWFREPASMPAKGVFQELVDTAFHASLLTEEKRRPGFRLIYCGPDDFPSDSPRYRLLPMPSPRPFSASELIRIAPAADLTRFLICVYPHETSQETLSIWGLLDVGDNWWRFLRHQTGHGIPPPNFLTITSTSPGELSFSAQGSVLLVLKDGELFRSEDPISAGPVAAYLEPARMSLYQETVDELGTKKWDSQGPDDDYPKRLYSDFLKSILQCVSDLGHGGTILVVPEEMDFDDPRITDRVLIKYPTDYDRAWQTLIKKLVNHHRYYDLYFGVLDQRVPLTLDRFQDYGVLERKIRDAERGIQDAAKCVASLAGLDGAVVISRRFKVLGFGGEILAASRTLDSVTEASGKRTRIPIESFGTRHRSAFRFCSSLEESCAFVFSTDGGAKAVKRNGPELLYWPNIDHGPAGLSL